MENLFSEISRYRAKQTHRKFSRAWVHEFKSRLSLSRHSWAPGTELFRTGSTGKHLQVADGDNPREVPDEDLLVLFPFYIRNIPIQKEGVELYWETDGSPATHDLFFQFIVSVILNRTDLGIVKSPCVVYKPRMKVSGKHANRLVKFEIVPAIQILNSRLVMIPDWAVRNANNPSTCFHWRVNTAYEQLQCWQHLPNRTLARNFAKLLKYFCKRSNLDDISSYAICCHAYNWAKRNSSASLNLASLYDFVRDFALRLKRGGILEIHREVQMNDATPRRVQCDVVSSFASDLENVQLWDSVRSYVVTKEYM